MVLQIKWTAEAKFQFKEILDYWDDRNGTSTYSAKLIRLFDQTINRLAEYPEIGRQTENSRIRLKIIKDYFLYYSFNDIQLTILGISDMRRDTQYLKSFSRVKKPRSHYPM